MGKQKAEKVISGDTELKDSASSDTIVEILVPDKTTKNSTPDGASTPEKTLSDGVNIGISVKLAESESDLTRGIYAFAYTVIISNNNQESISLVNRHWRVYSNGKQIADVKGEGVVGQQPVLRSGDSFEYTSWTVIPDSYGHMEGSFTFQNEDSVFFDVILPHLKLDVREGIAIH